MTYNSTGKRITSENLAGQITTTAWDCCHKVSETQPDGSTTTWDYDDEGRVIAPSRLIPLDITNVTWLTTCYSFDLNEDSLSIYSGGVVQSDCGSDTYGNEVFRLDAYSHADIDHCNLSDEIIELINMGAEISDEDI